MKTAPTGRKHIRTLFPDLRIIKEAELSEKAGTREGKQRKEHGSTPFRVYKFSEIWSNGSKRRNEK